MEAHVEDLCREYGIQLSGSSARGRAIRWRGGRLEISIPPWLFAFEHGVVEPTPATKRSSARRLQGYLAWARNRQHRRVPPRIPERDHPFWALLQLG